MTKATKRITTQQRVPPDVGGGPKRLKDLTDDFAVGWRVAGEQGQDATFYTLRRGPITPRDHLAKIEPKRLEAA